MKVSQDVLAVLDRATCQGNALSLTALGQLDRKLYTDTNKALEAAGGKWNRKAQAHLFDGDAAEAVEPIILTGEIVSRKVEFQQFYTPPDLAQRVIALAQITSGMDVLEPSAGIGSIAFWALQTGARVHVIEVDIVVANRYLTLEEGYTSTTGCDFLKAAPNSDFDRVVMNPPFARQDDIRHVMHAARFLKPSGRLVAIMSASIRFRQNRLADEFRAFLAEREAVIEDLPYGTFKSSGTNVATCLVLFDVPTPTGPYAAALPSVEGA